MHRGLYHQGTDSVDNLDLASNNGINLPTMTTIDSVYLRLRAIRISKGLSLADVEIESKGQIRAVVLGSYERGDRSLSVKRAIAIANFYGLPLSYLLEKPPQAPGIPEPAVIDLRRLSAIEEDQPASDRYRLTILATFIAQILTRRNDWNGEVLSLRSDDFTAMAMAMGINLQELMSILNANKILLSVK
ncbi:unannotated protein [freshwater metagenome]|uniref:Unannotated protein n=1 Tax=freshwater metagenome TaxID=449393 RepID=A0A6J6R5H2_9ZZZZ|nr:helix-turn-helix domain-containing protein [Actinomycetota bacterium]MSW62461.1 helix-turn-helix domain-containing protein [Actinomycetota bacterium]MSX89538.1 helix-turn-helix domain-containing protein [Actinomycetota bacterium]MSZ64604.1 helix-turn-helix domain-containing protein [Actinomycetota bacterium]MTA57676.1 helix-turn-helix domain-containing protein [Actinomycetota bacterium]